MQFGYGERPENENPERVQCSCRPDLAGLPFIKKRAVVAAALGLRTTVMTGLDLSQKVNFMSSAAFVVKKNHEGTKCTKKRHEDVRA